MQDTPTATETDMRDISLREAARLIGMSAVTLRRYWDEITTAYRTPGGQYRVSLWGLRQWQATRGK